MEVEAFKGKNILITGASGFIGHALTSSLANIDCSLTRISRDSNKLLTLSGIAAVRDVEIDYADPAAWSELISDVDIIFFLSAQTSSADANNDPDSDFQSNVLPLLNLLEACRESASKPMIVFASTATVVGLTPNFPVTEGLYENPITIYDIHKLCCEKYLSYYASKHYVTSCSLRLANVYGPGVSSSRADRGILNMMIRRATRKKNLTIYGDGLRLRDYSYISDIVSAFMAAAAHTDRTNGKVFNIGSGKGHTFIEAFSEITQSAKERLGEDVSVIHVDAPDDLDQIETRNYVADTTSFMKTTGWYALVDLKTGIQQTLDQFIENKLS